MEEKNANTRILVVIVGVVSLVIGSMGGVIGSMVLSPIVAQRWPHMMNWQKPSITNQKTVYDVEEHSATIDVVKKSSPAVVSIVVSKELKNVYNMTGPFFPFGMMNQPQEGTGGMQRIGGGTGFLISSDGMILTNRHVVEDDAAEYTVVLNDERTFTATVLGRDMVNDLAVLKIDGKDLPTIPLGDSEGIEIGQSVIAIGYTLGEYQNTVTKGVVSGIDRRVTAGNGMAFSEVIEAAIQTDAAINPGNSGGPLLDLQGNVIGINTAVNREGESIGFALPINVAKRTVESIQKYGTIVRPWLGVRYININEAFAKANEMTVTYGALVARGNDQLSLAIVPGSPADKAGIEENDIILAINDVKLDKHTLAAELQKYNPGDSIVLTVQRKGEEKKITVVLEKRAEQ